MRQSRGPLEVRETKGDCAGRGSVHERRGLGQRYTAGRGRSVIRRAPSTAQPPTARTSIANAIAPMKSLNFMRRRMTRSASADDAASRRLQVRLPLRLGAQVREDGEHAPMVFRGRRELQLGKDAGDRVKRGSGERGRSGTARIAAIRGEVMVNI